MLLLSHIDPAVPLRSLLCIEHVENPCGCLGLVRRITASGPTALRRIFQTHYKSYGKEMGFSYVPFLEILGSGPLSGLVTSNGEQWQARSRCRVAYSQQLLECLRGTEIITILSCS